MGVPAAAGRLMKICELQHAAKAPGLSVPFVADHRRARENGGEKKGKVEDGRNLLWWGRFDDQRARNSGGWRPCMQSHASISGRFVDTVVRTCRLSGQLQEKSFSSKNLSFETSEAWPGGQSDIIEHCRKQTKFSHWGFDRVEHRYESGTASESAKRAHVFAGLYSSVHSSVSFGGSGLLMTAPKHFGAFAVRRARSLQSTPPLWQIHLFAGRAVKRERRKGSSRRQQPAYGAAVNEVARELLRSVRSPKRENGGRRYIKHDGMIASPVGSCLCCWQLPLSPPVPPLYCSTPHCPSLSSTRFDAFKDVIVWIVHNMLPILSEQPRHLGYRPVYVGFPYDL